MRALAFAAAAVFWTAQAAKATAQDVESVPEGNTYVRNVLSSGPRSQDAAINDYSYDVEEVRENLDKHGASTSKETLKYEVYFVDGRPVRRLISRDGVPLGAREQADTDRKATELAKAISEGRTVREQAGIRLSGLVESFDFKTVAREDRGGRKTLVFDFAPKKGSARRTASANGPADAMAGILAGRLRIDELDRRVVSLDARNLDGQKASVASGVKVGAFELSIEFAPVEEHVWLPKRIMTVASGRAFIFKTFRKRKTTNYSNFRRFNVDTQEKPVGF